MAHSGRRIALIDAQPPRAWLWALGLGLLSATGFQPLGLWPLALLAMGAAVLLMARADGWRQAMWFGWLFGLAHFTLGNHWIAAAFTHQAQMPAALGWVAVPGLAAYLAIYPALAAGAARALARRGPGAGFALTFAACWIVAEWLRSWVFTGYAWNPLAMVLLGPIDRPGLAALSPLLGTYALSGVAVLIGGGLALLAAARRWLPAAAAAALLVAGMYWPAPAAEPGTLRVTIAQPFVRQAALNDPREYENTFRMLARLSLAQTADAGTPRIVLWPESGMADYLREGYPQRYYDATTAFGSPAYARRRLGNVVGEGSLLLTGAVDLAIGADESGTIRALGARNAVTAVSAQGAIIGGYAKAHLVPGGEYLPLRPLLEPLGLSRLVAGSIDFLPGPGPQTLDLGQFGKVSPQVCFEIIFSGQVTQPGNRPDYIFNPSSEGWFGASGPPQFLAQSRMRAIEEGLPVLRATNSGISAVIDPHGVVRENLGQQVEGRIDALVPAAAPPTLFARLGNRLCLFWAMVFLASGIVAMRHRGR